SLAKPPTIVTRGNDDGHSTHASSPRSVPVALRYALSTAALASFAHGLPPGCGSTAIGSPVFGSPVFGSPALGSPRFGSPPFASPLFGSPAFASPIFGSLLFASAVFGSP